MTDEQVVYLGMRIASGVFTMLGLAFVLAGLFCGLLGMPTGKP